MKKLNYESIKQEFEKEGYQLLSTEYINSRMSLSFICPNGHNHIIRWGHWKQGQRCGKCSGTHKHSYNFIKKSFAKEGYTLLTKEYKNAHKYLEYICPNGHKHKIRWSNWQQGYRCGKCSGTHKHSYNFIKQSFAKEGYTLLSKEYINNKEYLEFICLNGHKHRIKWGSWQQGVRCGKCQPKWSKPEKEIYNYIKNNYDGTIKENDRTLIKNPKTNQYLELDIWLPEKRKALEYNGEYYHKDKYSKWKDKYKQKWCKENNIDLLVINEENWNKDWNKINNFIGEYK